MYTGPAPAAQHQTSQLSHLFHHWLQLSSPALIDYFFNSHEIAASVREWRLIRVALQDSIALSPSCLQDGRFSVDFCIPHPADSRYNARLQYHSFNPLSTQMLTNDARLIRPSDSSEECAKRHHLVSCLLAG